MAAHRPSLLALADRVVHLEPAGAAALVTDPPSRDGRRSLSLRPDGPDARHRPAGVRAHGFASLLGAGAIAADIGLIGTAAWLISKAAQHPNEAAARPWPSWPCSSSGSSRGLFRYKERLVGHDAAFRLLADLRVKVYQRPRAAGALRPALVPARRPAGPDGARRRLPAGPGHPGDPRRSASPRWSGRPPWSSCGGCCPPPR